MSTKRQRYYKNRSDVRKLLKYLREGEAGSAVTAGHFGYTYNSRHGYWQFVNTLNNTVIATVRDWRDTRVIRYRKNSWYSDLLSDTTKYLSDRWSKVAVMPSETLGRHRSYAIEAVSTGIQRREREEEQNRVTREEAIATITDADVVDIAQSAWGVNPSVYTRRTVSGQTMEAMYTLARSRSQALYQTVTDGEERDDPIQ